MISSLTLSVRVSNTPFTKTSPNYLHIKNNADNSIKITITNSELPKMIRTLFTSAHQKKNLKRRMSVRGKGWPLTAPWKLSALFWNCVHKSEVWSRCGYYADNCSIEKVRITLVPFPILRPNNADIIRIIEFVKGVLVHIYIHHTNELSVWKACANEAWAKSTEWKDLSCQEGFLWL